MGTIVGSGEYTYRVEEGWGKLPPGWAFGDVAAVGTDAKDNVYVFNRGEHPMVVFDREGNFLRSWGEGIFPRAHGVHMGPDDTIYLTDDGDHTVQEVHARRQGAARRSAFPASRPSRSRASRSTAARIRRCRRRTTSTSRTATATRACTSTIPRAGCCSPGASPAPIPASSTSPTTSAATPTAGSTSPTARTIACRCSTARARYETQWNNLHRPSGLYMTPGKCPICYIGEIGPHLPVNRDAPNLGPRVSIVDHKGKLLARLARVPVARAPGRASSSRRTASASTVAAISTSARSPGPRGRRAIRASRAPSRCAPCRNSPRCRPARRADVRPGRCRSDRPGPTERALPTWNAFEQAFG